MRLIRIGADSTFSLVEYAGSRIPNYAILSHTWGADWEEVTLKDLREDIAQSRVGYQKLKFCGEKAKEHGLQFFWIDTCCIDKSSSSELTEAINSMFKWYQNASICFVYLTDVSIGTETLDDHAIQRLWHSTVQQSRWWTRGWTLQELIAPGRVNFFSKEGIEIGDKNSCIQHIHRITGIAVKVLQGIPLSLCSVDERMSWAYGRETKREEDLAYCLLGLFDVYMPLIYGEGQKRALGRLRKEIPEFTSNTETQTETAWKVLHTFITDIGPDEWNRKVQKSYRPKKQWHHLDLADNVELLASEFRKLSTAHSVHERKLRDYEKQIADLIEERNANQAEIADLIFGRIQPLDDNRGVKEEAEGAVSPMATQIHELQDQSMQVLQTLNRERTDLVAEIEQRTKALTVEDNFEFLIDTQISSKFAALVDTVAALSRLGHGRNRSQWSDAILSRLPGGRKSSRSYVLSNIIWRIFQEQIFCTPFRVFGTKSLSLEREWTRQFGEECDAINAEYIWPKATSESEKWRYKIMGDAVDASRTCHPETHTLLDGSLKNMITTEFRLVNDLQQLMKIDDDVVQSIRRACNEAARLWILFGAQRCRLVVVSYSADELVIRPELKMYGNTAGTRYHHESTVPGCFSDLLDIRYLKNKP